MWFKNLCLYKLTRPFEMTPEALAGALAAEATRPCGGLEPFTYGWAPPLGRLGSELVHAAGGRILLAARKEERLLPASVVREAVEERVADIEAREGRTVLGKARRRLREEVIFDLMPRAFTRATHTFGYLAPAEGWLVVDAASPKRAEEFTVTLGRSVPGLQFEAFSPAAPAAPAMTRWLEGGAPPRGFSIQHDCELRDPAEEGAVVRCQRQDLSGEEIRAHLRAHKQVARLALGFEERLSFTLGADLTVKRLRFEAVEELDRGDGGDDAARFDADFAYMSTEIGRLAARLAEVFGDSEAAAA